MDYSTKTFDNTLLCVYYVIDIKRSGAYPTNLKHSFVSVTNPDRDLAPILNLTPNILSLHVYPLTQADSFIQSDLQDNTDIFISMFVAWVL